MKYNSLIIYSLCILNIQGVLAKKTLRGSFPKNYATLKDSVTKEELSLIKAGYSLFSKPWVQAPASTKLRDGLGPHFSATSCISCHENMGRGKPIIKDNLVHPSLVFRLNNIQQMPDSNYGSQLTTQANIGFTPEATIKINYQYIKKYYDDKTNYTLTAPQYKFENLSNGPIDIETNFSPRIAPHLSGLGEIEKISSIQILSKHDPEDSNQDGISGKVNWVYNGIDKSIGRFGWKASQPTIHRQNAAAFSGDMSITSQFFPEESCSLTQHDCFNALTGGKPELSNKHLGYISLMLKKIAPPVSKVNFNINGKKIFKKIGCTSCHTPKYTLDSNETIMPYTDLLLHDMGKDLSDNGSTDLAREWKTPPLWGIGQQYLVNGHTKLLHDGRANSVEEAILWHSGEALASKNHFISLDKSDRVDLIEFINSL